MSRTGAHDGRDGSTTARAPAEAMLERSTESRPAPRGIRHDEDVVASAWSEPRLSIDGMIVVGRRQWRVIVLTCAVFLALGMIYVVTAVPKYTATTSVLIDSRRNQDQLSASIAELNFDTAAIDSQLEVIASDNVATGVVRALRLDEDPSFASGGSALGLLRRISDVRRWFGSASPEEADPGRTATGVAVTNLQANLSVRRVARTYVLQISFTWPDAVQAAKVANAFADAYFSEQMEARYDITRRASGWLQNRIKELKENSLRTDLAVQRFKARNGIVSNGTSLVSEQQLSEITTQLSVARSDTARAQARLNQIADILKSGRADGAVTESLGNPVVNDLRTKYLRASKSAAELTARVGPTHYQVMSLRNEMTQYERLIFEELQRIAETYVADLDVANAREKSLADSMAQKMSQQGASNEVMVTLRELEREAETFKTLYQTFLQRYQDAIQRESFPTSEARIISPANAPDRPTSPRSAIVLSLSFCLGLLAGAGAAATREWRDRVFRTGRQVRDGLGLDLLGIAPEIAEQAPPPPPGPQNPRHLCLTSERFRQSLHAPLSTFAEALRRAKVEVDLSVRKEGRAAVVGVVSILPGEGKTTISKNLASFLAMLGARTLLVDADLRNPGLTRGIAPHATAGLLDLLDGRARLEDTLLSEPETRLSVLPVVVADATLRSSDILASRAMADFLERARRNYDYIVVDLPPVGPVIDVRACSHLFDCFLLVTRWGKTPRNIVRDTLLQDPDMQAKCLGVILNRVAVDRLGLYERDAESSHYHSSYQAYYRSMQEKTPS